MSKARSALIWVDTLITAAGYGAGEDNDTASAQKVMTALRTLSQRSGALVIGVDQARADRRPRKARPTQ